MKKQQIGLIIAAALIIIAEFFFIDYDKLLSSKNIENYLIMIAMVMLIIGQFLFDKKSKK